MDRITKSLLDEFSAEALISQLPEDARFEHFTSFLTIGRHLEDTFDTADVVTGSGGDTGIDAIAVIVNGALVMDPEFVEELAKTNGHIDATFVFVQAERSSSFETAKIGQFGFGVIDFFKDRPTLPRNDRVTAAAEIMAAVYQRSSRFTRGNPVCRLFYTTTGRWSVDKALEARRSAVVEDLQQLNIFREVEFIPAGADILQKFYNESKNAISRDFTFSSKTVVPESVGVKEAYLGLLPAPDFLALLDDGNGGILKSIFYDNVRDWQEYNTVNSEIKASLQSEAHQARFALMNNGVTIIAKTLRTTGNRFHIEDYQIVNGCQTSHVLFDNKELLDSSVVIPVRIIATNDEEVIASIVKATNRQTEVKEEQLIALSDFQKKLEAYFLTFPEPQRLFYERRSRQYNSGSGVEKTRIITLTTLIRAYASSFLEEPHRTTRTYGALLQQIGKSIFGPEDRLEPYYYAASAHYRLEYLFRNGTVPASAKPARYHILMAARLLMHSAPLPRSNSHDMARLSERLTGAIWDPAKSDTTLRLAAEIVHEVAEGNFHRDQIRTQPFTEKVKAACVQ
ncbi:MAG: AIPR family protein [Candidatus Accumulibacter sp. UW20]